MKWLGLDWDEGPVFPEKRLPRYPEAADKLIAAGHAYPCWATKRAGRIEDPAKEKHEKPPHDEALAPERAAGMKNRKGSGRFIRFRDIMRARWA